jgi:hypothetical protein
MQTKARWRNGYCKMISPEFRELRDYSEDELFSMGRRFMNNSRYSEAEIIFDKLYKKGGIVMKEISSMYDFLIHSLTKRISDGMIINGVIRCMATLTEMYAEKTFSKKNFFDIETLLDRLPFRTMTISNREEFERIYSKFKEYSIDIFLGKK